MRLPKEKERDDSGVFALMFAEYASRNALIDFTLQHIPATRIKMLSDIMLKRIPIPLTT